MIYDNIKQICDEQGISIMECEKRARIGNGVIGSWRTSTPRLDKIQAVADALGVPLTELTRRDEREEC